jgi:hypothetical protein
MRASSGRLGRYLRSIEPANLRAYRPHRSFPSHIILIEANINSNIPLRTHAELVHSARVRGAFIRLCDN